MNSTSPFSPPRRILSALIPALGLCASLFVACGEDDDKTEAPERFDITVPKKGTVCTQGDSCRVEMVYRNYTDEQPIDVVVDLSIDGKHWITMNTDSSLTFSDKVRSWAFKMPDTLLHIDFANGKDETLKVSSASNKARLAVYLYDKAFAPDSIKALGDTSALFTIKPK